MTVHEERFIKGKRFTQEFTLNDSLDQVIPKVSAGSVIGDAISAATSGTMQTMSLSGHTLSISGGNSVTLPDNDTDAQTLSLSGTTLSISNGNSVTLPASGGTDSQTLSISGNTLSISNGNSVTLPSGSSGGGTGSVITFVGWSSGSVGPTTGMWLDAGVPVPVVRVVTSSGLTNGYQFTGTGAGGASNRFYLRGSDGVWYPSALITSGTSTTITLPDGITPTQLTQYVFDTSGN